MDRLSNIANLWNWLPAFRAVAETGNVRQAADRLHVSPSALSRTVRLLEDEMGRPLFDRIGRALKLNDAGEQLLSAVRESMRRIHDTTLSIDTALLTGLVRVGCPGTIIHAFVVPALPLLAAEHPGLVPVVSPFSDSAMVQALQVGDLDLAMSTKPIGADELTTIRFGECTNGVYCGRGHPLYEASSVEIAEILAHPFVAPPSDDGVPLEGWPVEMSRKVGAYVTSLAAGLQVCRSGSMLAVLPDVIGRREQDERALFRLPFEGIDPMPFYACHRPTLDVVGRAEAMLAAVQAVVARDLPDA